MNRKYKTAVNRYFIILVAVFNVIIALLFSTKVFTETSFGVNAGFVFLAIDILYIIPCIFFTYYEIREDYLYIHDYPLRTYKIKYSDIFNVEDGDYKAKSKSVVALSTDRIAIGFKKTSQSGDTDEKYVFISPADMNLFLLKLSAKLENNKEEVQQKAKEVSEKQAEHEKMKQQAEKKKKEKQKENEPEIIRVSEVKKFSDFKTKVVDEQDEDGKSE